MVAPTTIRHHRARKHRRRSWPPAAAKPPSRCCARSDSSTSSTRRSSTSRCRRSAPTCTSPTSHCSGCSAATCSPTAASCCSAAAPPTCSAAAGCWSPAPSLFGARVAVGRRRPERRPAGRRPAWSRALAAAMMLPATLSTLTTTVHRGQRPQHRARRLGRRRWARLGGRRLPRRGPHRGPGLALGVLRQPADLRRPGRPRAADHPEPRAGTARGQSFDVLGAALATAGMLTLVYTLVKAPDVGWSTARTIGGLGAAAVLLALFVVNEARRAEPLVPLSIFRVRGLAAANVTQLTMVAGMLADVLLPHPLHAERARLHAAADRRGLPAAVRRRRASPPASPRSCCRRARHPADRRDRCADRCRRHLLAVPDPRRRALRQRHPARHRWSCRSASAPSSWRSPPPPTPAYRSARPASPPRCSTPPSRSAARSGSRSSRRSPPPAPRICWPPGIRLPDALTGGFARTLLVSSLFVLAAGALALRIKQTRQAPAGM